MITVRTEQQNGNGKEFGYGVYVNAFVTWDDDQDEMPNVYASECVPFGKNTSENIAAAEKRVRRNATRRAKREWMG